MLVADDGLAVGVDQVEGQAAELGALAAVGRAVEAILRGVAPAAEAHAERPVHEGFERNGRGGMDGADVGQREFACQHHLLEARTGQEGHLLGRAVVHLRRGVQGDGRQVEPQQAHVLHDERVGACAVQLVDEAFHGGELVVVEDGVERHVDARPERVGVVGQAGDVADRVARSGAGTESRSADIDGVGAVADGLDAGVGVAGGGKEFDGSGCHWSVA